MRYFDSTEFRTGGSRALRGLKLAGALLATAALLVGLLLVGLGLAEVRQSRLDLELPESTPATATESPVADLVPPSPVRHVSLPLPEGRVHAPPVSRTRRQQPVYSRSRPAYGGSGFNPWLPESW